MIFIEIYGVFSKFSTQHNLNNKEIKFTIFENGADIFWQNNFEFTVFENDIDFVLTDRAAYITVMKICKLMLTTVSHAKFQVVVEACSADPQSPNITQAEHSHALILQQALQFIPNPGAEVMTRTVGLRLGQQLLDQVL